MKEPSTVENAVEFWRWQEYQRIMPGKSWKSKDLITAGVDVGSVGSKAAIMVNGEAYSWGIIRTGSNSPESATKALDYALKGTGLKISDLKYIVGTGYGRVNVPMANKAITEIACHAKGANYIWGPSVRTVLDVGGRHASIADASVLETGGSWFWVRPSAEGLAELGRLADAGQLRVPVADVLPLEELPAAFALSREGHVRGKLVISVAD